MEYQALFSKCLYQTMSWSLKHILDLVDKRTGGLNLNPDYQRDDVWNVKTREHFIHTLMHGRSFPPLQLIDERDGRPNDVQPPSNCNYETLDGRNRIRTCVMFRSGEFGITIRGGKKKKVFWKDLDERDQQEFDEFQIPIVMMRWMCYENRIEHFNALQMGVRLNSFEQMKNSNTPCMQLFNSLITKYAEHISKILPYKCKRGAGMNLVANIFEICRGGISAGTSGQIGKFAQRIPHDEPLTQLGLRVGKIVTFLYDYLCVSHDIVIHSSVQLAMLTDMAWVFVDSGDISEKINLHMLPFITDVNLYCATRLCDNQFAIDYVKTHLSIGNRERFEAPVCIERRKIVKKMFDDAQGLPRVWV